MDKQPVMKTYGRLPATFERGEGSWLYDAQGNAYLDALSGIAVTGLGHAHPAVTKAISEQAASLIHTSNLYTIENQEQLAARLTRISGMDNVFFGNSGAEANEAAIKIARRYGHNKGIELPTIIVMEGAFHGRTMATLTATGNRSAQAGFEPLVAGFVRAPYDDIEAVKAIAENNPNVVGVLVEPVQGESGVHIPSADYLRQLRNVCDQYDWLLMLDEVQTGNGRTGKYFAFQHSDIIPDVLTTAKGLGNGLPIGACLAQGKAANVFQPGNHGSTFGGNPLCCAAAIAVVDTIESQNLCARAAQLGERLRTGFASALESQTQVKEVRNAGLMVAIELHTEVPNFAATALDNKILLNVTGAGRIVRMLPPLTLTDDEATQLVNSVSELLLRELSEQD
ncbi:MAG: aspartate aminotransferase family protein [Pontibacterium sp.]